MTTEFFAISIFILRIRNISFRKNRIIIELNRYNYFENANYRKQIMNFY